MRRLKQQPKRRTLKQPPVTIEILVDAWPTPTQDELDFMRAERLRKEEEELRQYGKGYPLGSKDTMRIGNKGEQEMALRKEKAEEWRTKRYWWKKSPPWRDDD